MSRPIDSANQAQVESPVVRPVEMAHFAFNTPVFVHSGIGNITYDGNVYLGAGGLIAVDGLEESEDIAPTQIDFTLNYVPSQYVSEALDAGNYGDVITFYSGYKGTDGRLVADPELAGRAFFEHAAIKMGNENAITVSSQHEVTVIDERPGRRYSDEDWRAEFPSETGGSFAADIPTRKLLWGGQAGFAGAPGGGGGAGNNTRRHHL